jgi:CRISPR system Cascade subunit CasC
VRALDGGKARDVALFGRMLADLPEARVDAACQVAHAISTNRVNMEFDYYTAVDDLKPEDTQGADMIGDVQFNSACFYRYLNVDIEQLAANLGDDRAAAIETVRAFIQAAIEAIPTGKQNSMAAQNPPSLVLAVVRRHGAWSLANAFVEPVRPTANENLIVGSIRKLDEYWARLSGMYGAGTLLGAFVCTTEPETLCALSQDVQPGVVKVKSVDELKCAVTETLKRN